MTLHAGAQMKQPAITILCRFQRRFRLYTADPCDDENGLTMNDVITESCECIGEVVVEVH